MPLSPHLRRPALTPVNHALANADQNLTEVDTRLTKVDKGCQKLTPSTPAPTPNPSKTQHNRNRAHPVDTYSVNPRCQPLRRTLNNPEQIRTNLNKPEHRQAPRPDREAARITPQHPEKKESRTPSPPTPSVIPAPPPPRHSCAGRNPRATAGAHATADPLLVPLKGGRDESSQSLPPQENSSLPPFRGEARWGVRRTERPPAIIRAAPRSSTPRISHAAHLPRRASPTPRISHTVIPAPPPPRHSCAGRNDGGCAQGAGARPAWPAASHPPPTLPPFRGEG